MTNRLKAWLAEPLTYGADVDDPRTTYLKARVIRRKRFLGLIYDEWYRRLVEELPPGPGAALEIGSGAGFMKEYVPGLITSEVFPVENVAVALDAMQLPFANRALRAILMTDVLHHISGVRRFFAEATRCVKPGGVIVMIEPWTTPWSCQIYTRLHHEPFEPNASDWHFPQNGLSSYANGALPWILFERDRAQFVREFPSWRIKSIEPMMPFRYLLSGGLSVRSLMPGWSFGAWRTVERVLQPWMSFWAMFARIVLVKTNEQS